MLTFYKKTMKKLIPKNFKKILKKIKKILLKEIIILLRPILLKLGFDFIPFFDRGLIKEIKYLEKKMTYSYIPDLDQRFNSITIDTSYAKTALCDLGKKYPTDKSPYNEIELYNHSYSAIYNLLFSNIRYNELLIAEIGIYHNNSIKCWREFFKNAIIYGLDFDINFLENAKKDNLNNVHYEFLNVRDDNNIQTCFKKIIEKHNKKFDLIIDDSLHDNIEANISLKKINGLYQFLKPGGILNEKTIKEQGLIDYTKVNKLLKRHLSKKENLTNPLWNLLMFQSWYQNS